MNKYSVIYADVPWKQKAGRPLTGYVMEDGKQIFNPLSNKSNDLPYPTMSLEEIKNLPVKDLAADDAHLYFWVTNKYLPDAFGIIEAWGFKYSTTLVWCKNSLGGGLGGNYKISTEFLIFATRGSLKAKTQHIGTWFNIKRPYENGKPKHSKKPDFFHEIIEKVSPGPYLELFARRSRENWHIFGNEVESDIFIKDVWNEDLNW